ncbi:Rv0361 family membrane protein [Nocardia sp. NPDC004582]
MSDAEETPVRIDQNETRSMWPFLVAAGIIAVVILGIVVASVVSPVEKNVTDSDRLSAAADAFIRSRQDTGKYDPRLQCQAFDDKLSPLRIAVETGGTIAYSKLTDATVQGDAATAQVSFTVAGAPTTAPWHFAKENSRWLVCNS